MGRFNLSLIDTNIGADPECPFSPTAGWEGGRKEYLVLMRCRLKDRNFSQRMYAAGWTMARIKIQFVGPFAAEAAYVINRLKPARVVDPDRGLDAA